MNKRIFLDYASITPVGAEVQKAVREAEKRFWANPASIHTEGEGAKRILEEARIRIARILHCRAAEVHFTSGGTESLNLAILGTVKHAARFFEVPHIITSAIEHPAVLEPIKALVKEGRAEATYIYPREDGTINPESLKRELKEKTVLVAIQHANNEIGTIQPIREISNILKIKNHELSKNKLLPGAALLVDASQSALFEDVSMERLGAHMLVLDGVKLYGPRGIGVLAVKKGADISPIAYGGGQEGGLRPGTQNVPLAAGMAKALEIAEINRKSDSARICKLRDYAAGEILKKIPNSSLNGGNANRLPNNINICFPGNDSEFLVIKLDTLGFAVSAASACHALSLDNSSYVIEAVGGKDCAASSLRITFGRETKKSDLDSLISALKKIIK